MQERYIAEPQPESFVTLMTALNLPDPRSMERAAFVDGLFAMSSDAKVELRELGNLFKAQEQMLAHRRETSPVTAVEPTMPKTFERYALTKAEVTRDGVFVLLPATQGELVDISDAHGNRPVIQAAIERFLADPHNHFVSRGDNVNSKDVPYRDQIAALKAMIKLQLIYPERVHLLQGNNEVDIAPSMGYGDAHYYGVDDDKALFQLKRSERVFKQWPLLLATANGLVGVHGNLPVFSDKNELEENPPPSPVNNFQELQLSLAHSARARFRLTWGEKSKAKGPESKGVLDDVTPHSFGGLSYIGEQGVLKAIDAIGASVEIVGHQHSYARLYGEPEGHPSYAITHGSRVATMVSLPMGELKQGSFAVIPLWKPLKQWEDPMFHTVQYKK